MTPISTDYRWLHKHLLGLEELSVEDIRFLLQSARGFEEVSTRSVKKIPSLRGKVIANLFFEDSTRTRMSFELAANRMSADVLNFSSKGLFKIKAVCWLPNLPMGKPTTA